MKIAGKTFFITGGNRGIGLALGQGLNDKDANVIIGMRRPEEFESVVSAFTKPDLVTSVKIDMLDRNSIIEAIETVGEKVDCLVNNAGLLTGGLLENQPDDDIDNMVQVNLTNTMILTKKILPYFIKKGSGKIINNCSVSAVGHLPCASTYAAAKAGLLAFTNSLSVELAPAGITTLALITPGIKTRMYDDIPNLYGDHINMDILDSITPEEYAKKVIKAIESDQKIWWPSGQLRVVMSVAKHAPGLYQKMAARLFKR